MFASVQPTVLPLPGRLLLQQLASTARLATSPRPPMHDVCPDASVRPMQLQNVHDMRHLRKHLSRSTSRNWGAGRNRFWPRFLQCLRAPRGDVPIVSCGVTCLCEVTYLSHTPALPSRRTILPNDLPQKRTLLPPPRQRMRSTLRWANYLKNCVS